MPNFMQQPPQHSVMGGPAMSPVAAAGGVFPGAPIQPTNVAAAEVVPLPDVQASAAEGSAVGGFMAKFQVHFPHTGNDNPARRITSGDHTDTQGWTWRLVLHPWGHDARGCYSTFLELANADSLPLGFSRYVKLEFAMHAWDAAYHRVEPIRTQFLLHKFNGQATDFGYTRAFEHEIIMAQRNIFIDPQGFVRISVKIIDVREAFFRVATDVDLARSVTGRGGGGDFADWRTCLPAKSFKHDQLLYVIQKVSELTGVPLVSCRPWLCMPRDNGNGPVGPVRPVAALLPQHLQMTISEALGDRPQYHIYLEEVDTNPEVWARRRAFPRELPAQEAGQLLLTGRAYAQLPNEVFLVFLKIDRRIILAHTVPQDPLALSAVPAPAGADNQPEFVFVGKAMAHMTDRGCELAPIAKNLAHLPQSLNLEVFEQIAPEEVRRFSGDKTVAEAGLSHGSVLLFRSALQESVTWPSHGAKQAQLAQQQHAAAAPAVGVSSCVPFNAAAAAAAAAAMAAHAAVTGAPTPLATPARSGGDAAGAAGTASAPAAASATENVAASATAAGASAEATDCPASAPVTAAVPGNGGGASLSHESPPALIPAAAVAGNGLTDNGDGGCHDPTITTAVAAGPKHAKTGAVAEGAEKNAPGWDGGHIAAAAGPAVGVVRAKGSSGGEKPVVMDAKAQQRATELALFQVQENARQHQVKETARAVAKKLAAEAALAAAKEKFKKDAVVLSGGGAGFSAAAAKIVEGEGKKAVAVAEAAAAAAAAAMKAPAAPVLTPAEKAEVAAAAKMAAHVAAMEHAQSRAANTYRTISITEALREGAPPTPSGPVPPATAASNAPAVAETAPGQAVAQAATAFSMGVDAKVEATTSPGSVAPVPSTKDLKSTNVAAPVSTASSSSSPSIAADAGAAAKVGDVDAGGEMESGAEMEVDVDGRANALPNTAVVTNTPTDTLTGSADQSEKKGGSEDGSAPSSTTPTCTTSVNRDAAAAAAAAASPDDGNTSTTTGNPTRSPTSSRHAPGREQTGTAPSRSSVCADEKEGGDGDGLVEAAAAGAAAAVTVPAARATPAPVAVPRATRASKAAAAAVGSSEDDDGPESGGAAVAAVPVEIHRRSSRKAAAVAAQQIQTTARAGTRGGGGGGGGGSGSVSADVVVLRSPRGVNDDGGSGGQKRKAEEGEGQVSKKLSKVDTGGSSEMSAVPATSPVPSDLSAFIAQLMHVPGFTMEKCMELTRSKERAEIASAIKTMSPDEKDSFRSRQLERLLAIQEKEASSTEGVGGGRGE